MADIVNAIVVYGGRILTVKRAKAPYIGLYALPGGKVEPGETKEDAVLRELKEETSYDCSVIAFLEMIPNNGNDCHIFACKAVSAPEVQHADVEWLNIDAFTENYAGYNPENWQRLLPLIDKQLAHE